MTEFWQERLAHFDEAPVVDLYGVGSTMKGWAALDQTQSREPDALGRSGFDFPVWRVDKGEVQTTFIYVTVVISYQEWDSLVGSQGVLRPGLYPPIFHLKAKIARSLNLNGIQEALCVEFVSVVKDDEELNELCRQLTRTVVLDSPPLPRLRLSHDGTWREGSWEGTIALPSWKDFFLRSEPHYRRSRDTGFDLRIDCAEIAEMKLGYQVTPPPPEQIAAYVYLRENDAHVQVTLLRALLDVYPQWQEENPVEPEYMPDVSEPQGFQSLLVLNDVLIQSQTKDECAYVYLSLYPDWEIEHGMGAVLHRDQVLALGRHEDIWDAAERDLRSG